MLQLIETGIKQCTRDGLGSLDEFPLSSPYLIRQRTSFGKSVSDTPLDRGYLVIEILYGKPAVLYDIMIYPAHDMPGPAELEHPVETEIVGRTQITVGGVDEPRKIAKVVKCLAVTAAQSAMQIRREVPVPSSCIILAEEIEKTEIKISVVDEATGKLETLHRKCLVQIQSRRSRNDLVRFSGGPEKRNWIDEGRKPKDIAVEHIGGACTQGKCIPGPSQSAKVHGSGKCVLVHQQQAGRKGKGNPATNLMGKIPSLFSSH